MASCVQCRAVASAARPAAGRAPPSSSAFIGGSSGLRAPLRASSRPPARRVAVQGLFGLGVPEIAVIAGVTALIFGALGVAAASETLRCRPLPPTAGVFAMFAM
jgi:hypothetical protein